MNNFERDQIIKNLQDSPLIKAARVSGDRMYIELVGGDKRDNISVNLTNGIMFIKKLQNGMYRDTYARICHLVNDVNF